MKTLSAAAAAFFVIGLAGACSSMNMPSHEARADGGETQAEETQIVDRESVDNALRSLVENGEAAGVSALIYEDGEEVYFGAFGMADREAGRPMTRDTIAQIYSMTKPITGVALMTLYEKGAFKLDDPIEKYVPEFAGLMVYAGTDENGEPVLVEPKRAPTVRDFTRHTAGLAAGYGGSTPVDEWYREEAPLDRAKTYDDMAQAIARVPLLYHPGERWLYSDSVDVQALLVERLSGKPFAEYLREIIFDPLGMDETGYFVEEEKRGRLAALYESQEDGTLGRIPEDNTLNQNVLREWPLDPGGWGLASTLDDYMRFARMLANEGALDGARILKPETVRLMATDHLPETVTDRSWLPGKGAVGFGIDFAVRIAPPAGPEENAGAVGEFFWDGLASTLFWVDPENDVVAVLFLQRIPFYGSAHKKFRDAVYRGGSSVE